MTVSSRDESILKAVAAVIREQVGKAFDALLKKTEAVQRELEALRARLDNTPAPPKGEKGDPGQSVTLDDVLPALKSAALERVAGFLDDLEPPRDGKSVTLDEVRPLLESGMDKWALDFERRAQDVQQRAIDRIQPPANGRDGRDGIDGKDADPDEVAARVIARLDLKGTSESAIRKLCKELVAAEIEAFPRPQDGADGRDGADGQDGPPGQDGADGRDGADGKSIELKDVQDYLKSLSDSWALDFEKRAQAMLQKAVEAIPHPQDGADGLSFNDVRIELLEDERTLRYFAERDGRQVEQLVRLTHPIDRGVFKAGDKYLKGDAVSWGGSLWIAQVDDPKGKPGEYNKHWRLAVKRGRDGKDAA